MVVDAGHLPLWMLEFLLIPMSCTSKCAMNSELGRRFGHLQEWFYGWNRSATAVRVSEIACHICVSLWVTE